MYIYIYNSLYEWHHDRKSYDINEEKKVKEVEKPAMVLHLWCCVQVAILLD